MEKGFILAQSLRVQFLMEQKSQQLVTLLPESGIREWQLLNSLSNFLFSPEFQPMG